MINYHKFFYLLKKAMGSVIRKRVDTSKTRKTSDDRKECTKKYTTKAERSLTQYCEVYTRFAAAKKSCSQQLFFNYLTSFTAARVFSSISLGVPLIIQLPPQAIILSYARYSKILSAEIPPVGIICK